VELAYFNLENARDQTFAPPIPTASIVAGGGGAGGGGNFSAAAALTQQLLQAQTNLIGSQNTLYRTWVNYHTVRLQLFRDLELLPLDSRGVFIDELAARRPDDSPANSDAPGREGGQRGQPGAQDDALEQLPTPRLVPDAEGPPLGQNP